MMGFNRTTLVLLALASYALLRCSSSSVNEGNGGDGGADATVGGAGGMGGAGGKDSGGVGGTDAPADAPTDQEPAPTCGDGKKNGNEVAVDCGGGCQCDPGQPCQKDTDCKKTACVGSTCLPPNCSDTIFNGQESDVDCGGPACPKCADLGACGQASDCASGVCTQSICQVPTCSDQSKNGAETDVDCGGTTCTSTCANGLACAVGDDCASKVCQSNKCVAATCTDAIKNGDETDQDCGGSCGSCNAGSACLVPSDCKSSVCAGNVCQAPACNDGSKNGAETDVDCGASCPTCADGKACSSASDCASGVCAGNLCLVPTCSDKVKNGGESDVDCGGAVCAKCPNGKGCATGADCVSGGCASQLCARWAKRFGSTEADIGLAVALDSKGDIFLGGSFIGSVTFGGPTLVSSAGSADGFVVKLSRTGDHIWTKAVSGTGIEGVTGLAVDSADNVFVSGYANTCNIGGPTLTSAGAQDVLVAKLAGTDGAHIWSKLLGGSATDQPGGLALDSTGDVIVVGQSTSPSYSLGGATFTGQGNFDALIVKLQGSDGGHVWSKSFGAAGVDGFNAVAVTPTGDVFATGRLQQTVSFGGPPLTSNGAIDIALVKLAKADGAHLWSRSFGNINNDVGRSVISDPAGNAVFVGFRNSAVDLGSGTPIPAGGQFDLAMGKYASADGTHAWSLGPGGSLTESFTDVAQDGTDFIALGAYLSTNLNLGFGTLPAPTVDSILAMRVAGTNGAALGSWTFLGTGAAVVPSRIAVHPPTHGGVMVGYFGGSLDFGNVQLTTAGKDDIFVASLGSLP